MSKEIQAALAQLDPSNDNHWTADGLARLDTVKLLAGDSAVTREHVTLAAPGFTRAAALQGVAPASGGGSPTLEPETALPGPQGPSLGVGNGEEQAVPGVVADTVAQNETPAVPLPTESPRAVAQRIYDFALAEQRAADREVKEAQATLDFCIQAEQQALGPQTLASAVSGYHAQQQRQREENAARRAALKGVKLEDILPSRAKIDEMLARRKGFGNKRPTRI